MGYRVLAGIDYPPNKRAEAGDVVDDLAPQSIKWLLSAGIIEDNSKSPKAVEKEPEATPEPVVLQEPTPEVIAEPEIIEEPVVIEEATPEPEIETPAVEPTPEVADAEADNDSEPQKVEEE